MYRHTIRDALHYIFVSKLYHDYDNYLIKLVQFLLFIDGGIDLMNAQTKMGSSPLHVLFRYNNHGNLVDLVKFLIKRGVDLNCRGWTSLHLTCRYYNHENLLPLVELLKEKEVDMAAKTKEGHSAFYLLKAVYWNPPKNGDQVIAIFPVNFKQLFSMGTGLYR